MSTSNQTRTISSSRPSSRCRHVWSGTDSRVDCSRAALATSCCCCCLGCAAASPSGVCGHRRYRYARSCVRHIHRVHIKRCAKVAGSDRVIAGWAGLTIHLMVAGLECETAQPSRCRPTFRLYLAVHMQDRQARLPTANARECRPCASGRFRAT